MRRCHRRILLIIVIFFTFTSNIGAQVQPLPTTAPSTLIESEEYIRSDRLGITFINSDDILASDDRYRNALILGAGWTRYPVYWNRVETIPGQFDWNRFDRVISNDIRHDLQINAILLGKPVFRSDGANIANLNEPIFSDGSDYPREGKFLNPDNPWVNFVYEAVQRYKPGGALAQEQGWDEGQGIRVWEIWNEPDHKPFWNASIWEYSRLLKSAYIVIKWADPEATVMFGGLLFPEDGVNWLTQVLAIYINDPLREEFNWYMDAIAFHSYGYPWRTGWLTLVIKQSLKAYEIDKPIWLNETGAPVWDDYPGPVWSNASDERTNRLTAEQQAWYFIQSTVYAWAGGAEKVFYHQLYDDCGDQPAGTNFPPHNGEICANGGICFGDGFGLYRNETNAICYSQHPFPGTQRPVAGAYQLLADVFGDEPFISLGKDEDILNADVFVFERPTTDERVTVLWNRTLEPVTIEIPASSAIADLYTINQHRVLASQNDIYAIVLTPAQPTLSTKLEINDVTAVGGEPIILIEKGIREPAPATPFNTLVPVPTSTPSAPLTITPGPITIE